MPKVDCRKRQWKLVSVSVCYSLSPFYLTHTRPCPHVYIHAHTHQQVCEWYCISNTDMQFSFWHLYQSVWSLFSLVSQYYSYHVLRSTFRRLREFYFDWPNNTFIYRTLVLTVFY